MMKKISGSGPVRDGVVGVSGDGAVHDVCLNSESSQLASVVVVVARTPRGSLLIIVGVSLRSRPAPWNAARPSSS
jgi:hypothetical protein